MANKENIKNNTPERGDISNITLQDISRYKFVLKYIENKKVLDIACGTGWGSLMMIKEGKAAEVWGVDVDKKTIDENLTTYKNHSNLFFQQGSGYNLNFDENFFDVSISIETLEHLDDPNAFLSELKRVTKRTGVIIISTPLNNGDSRFHPSNPFHYREYNEQELTDLYNQYFSSFDFFYQINVLKRNWLTRLTDFLLPKTSFLRVLIKRSIPPNTIKYLRHLFKANKDRTIKSEIGHSSDNASVVIAVIKNHAK